MSIPDSNSAQGRRPERFGAVVPELAQYIATEIEPDTLAFLAEVNRRWPTLTFRDFYAANTLAAAWRMKVEGHA
jgi:hypothetical protein